MRVDQLLVSQGLAPTRAAAPRLISTGAVRGVSPAGWVVPRTAGGLFPVHGVLGVDLLSRCRVTLDRGRARLLAVP